MKKRKFPPKDMSPLYINEILSPSQKSVFKKLMVFKKLGVLARDTALAFQLKHRMGYFGDLEDLRISFLKERYEPEEIQKFFEKKVEEYLKKKIK